MRPLLRCRRSSSAETPIDVHLTGVVPGRDFALERVFDLRNAESGDACPRCGKPLEMKAGLEVGHVFKLGTKYSKSMGATYLDEKGQRGPRDHGLLRHRHQPHSRWRRRERA